MKTIQTLMITCILFFSILSMAQVHIPRPYDTVGWTKRISQIEIWGNIRDTAYEYYKIDTSRKLIYFVDTANRMYGMIQWTWGFKIVTFVRPSISSYIYEEDCFYLDYRRNPFRQSIIRLENIY